jgi:8-oxo-dGTP pyrophosphatase MutT (NUDIX family)
MLLAHVPAHKRKPVPMNRWSKKFVAVTFRFFERGSRWILHRYDRYSRAMTLGVRALILDGDGRIFLIKHSYVSGWHMPGGGVEKGETLLVALEREVWEEGNIEVSEPPVLHAVYFNNRDSRRDHVALYIVRRFRQIGHGFFATNELPTDTTTATRDRIAEVLTGRQPAEFW